MSTAITKSGYGYWLDADANVHPVTQAEEHSGVALRLLGDAFEQALALDSNAPQAEFERFGASYPPSLQIS